MTSILGITRKHFENTLKVRTSDLEGCSIQSECIDKIEKLIRHSDFLDKSEGIKAIKALKPLANRQINALTPEEKNRILDILSGTYELEPTKGRSYKAEGSRLTFAEKVTNALRKVYRSVRNFFHKTPQTLDLVTAEQKRKEERPNLQEVMTCLSELEGDQTIHWNISRHPQERTETSISLELPSFLVPENSLKEALEEEIKSAKKLKIGDKTLNVTEQFDLDNLSAQRSAHYDFLLEGTETTQISPSSKAKAETLLLCLDELSGSSDPLFLHLQSLSCQAALSFIYGTLKSKTDFFFNTARGSIPPNFEATSIQFSKKDPQTISVKISWFILYYSSCISKEVTKEQYEALETLGIKPILSDHAECTFDLKVAEDGSPIFEHVSTKLSIESPE